jgi:hypothetical protein
MKRLSLFLFSLLLAAPAFAASLTAQASTTIPAETQQIIAINYRQVNGSPGGLALKERLMPQNLKDLEAALRGVGIDPNQNVELLTFASYRDGSVLRVIGIAQGSFSRAAVLKQLKAKKMQRQSFEGNSVYPMANGMAMSFIDESSLLFGDAAAIKPALQVRGGARQSVSGNARINELIGDVSDAPIWSVLDEQGTQVMMRSALGQAAQLAEYDSLKKRLLGSMYTMDFGNNVDFDLNVLTSDSMTASTLSTVIKAGMLFKKTSATPNEKLALESTTVDSSGDKLRIHFQTDEKRFEALLSSELFAAVSH